MIFSCLKLIRYFLIQKKPSLIIGADTVVTLNKEIFGKPKDESDAFSMLER